jgi:hypothetical protein
MFRLLPGAKVKALICNGRQFEDLSTQVGEKFLEVMCELEITVYGGWKDLLMM